MQRLLSVFLLLCALPALGAVVVKDVVIYQGARYDTLLAAPGLETAGRGLRAHIRNATPTATVIQILTYNGDADERVAFGSGGVQVTIGGAVSSLWAVNAPRVEWVYDVESYDLSDTEDVEQVLRGKVIVYGNVTRESDVTPSAQMPSGDGRYVRFDTDAQGLSEPQKLAARTNIGAGTGSGGGGSGDVVGPASVTDDRIAAFDGTTGKLIKQGTATATTVVAHMTSTSDPHGDRAFATSADSTHSALTTGVHGITAAGAALVDDASASAQRTTLGLGTAAVAATGDFEAAGSIATHAAVTSSVHGISTFGATLVDDAAASNARTTLGLVPGTDVQTQDAELSALAGLTSAADKGLQFTGSGTAATYDLTAAGKALLDDAAASNQRTTLGLGTAATSATGDFEAAGSIATHAALTSSVHGITATGAALIDDASTSAQRTTMGVAIGSDVQAYDGELTALAGLTSAADKGIQFSGAGTAATFDLTTAGKALLDDAAASNQRTTMGVAIGTDVQAWDADLDAFALETAPTGVVVGTTDTQTLTNKTLSSSTTFTAGPTMTFGSDATGDIYYRNSGGVLTRLGIGSSTNVLTVTGGLPVWAAASGLTGFTAAENTASPNNTINVDSLTAASATTHADIALVPKGSSGSILASIPDSGTGGGNRPGAASVCLQLTRASAGQACTGTNTTISGGSSNTASSNYSTVSGGQGNIASTSTHATVVGGQTNTASGAWSVAGGGSSVASGQTSVALGSSNTASGTSSAAFGSGNTASATGAFTAGSSNVASGTYAAAFGQTNTASGSYSFAHGTQATTRTLVSAHAYSGGQRSALGDAQMISQPVRRTTSDATPVSLATNGTPDGTTVMVLPASSTLACEALVVAQSASAANNAGYKILAVIQRDGSSNTALVGTATTTTIAEDSAGMDATIIANDTLESAEIQVTGVAATTIQWAAELKCAQVL